MIKVPEQKVILCGEYGVGKSSLFRRFMTDTFVASSDRKSTIGLDHYEKIYTSAEREIKLQLWDTGGMERIASVTSSYYKFAEAAILVFAADNRDSFNLLSQHLLEVISFAENAKIFLCCNKIDIAKNSSAQVSDAEINIFCEQFHNVVSAVYKTSCKTGEGVEEMFDDVAKTLLEQNRSRLELEALEQESFRLMNADEPPPTSDQCSC